METEENSQVIESTDSVGESENPVDVEPITEPFSGPIEIVIDPEIYRLLNSIVEGIGWNLIVLVAIMCILLVSVFLTGIKAGK